MGSDDQIILSFCQFCDSVIRGDYRLCYRPKGITGYRVSRVTVSVEMTTLILTNVYFLTCYRKNYLQCYCKKATAVRVSNREGNLEKLIGNEVWKRGCKRSGPVGR